MGSYPLLLGGDLIAVVIFFMAVIPSRSRPEAGSGDIIRGAMIPNRPSSPDPIRHAVDVMFCLWARERFPISKECRLTATSFAIYLIEHQDEIEELSAQATTRKESEANA